LGRPAGCCSFRREKYIDHGGPNGGDGGDGGRVIVRAVPNHTTLAGVRRTYIAPNGESGKGSFMHGKRGRDEVVLVPVGTAIAPLVRSSREANLTHSDLMLSASGSGAPQARW